MSIELRGARVWDGRARETSPGPATIEIDAERIVSIRSAGGSGGGGFDLAGCTVIPGLIDAHVHMTLDPELRSPGEQLRTPQGRLEEQMRARALAMVRAGITTARDLGGGAWLEIALRDRIARGELPGPRLLCAGQPVTSPGGHCFFWGGEARSEREIERVVKRQTDHGADWIKVMATGGMLTRGTRVREAQFDLDGLRAAVAAARARGREVAAHCHGTRGIALAAEAGVRTIEHCSWVGDAGFGSAFDPDVAEVLAKAGSFVSPTINAGWKRFLSGKGGKPSERAARMRACFAGLRSAGVELIASTDAGIPNVAHHRLPAALAVFAEIAELEPVEALRAATSNAARALGLEGRTGQLLPGYEADLLVVEGDPLHDLAALERPRLVVARGRVFELD